ncbi:hypothetical protein O3G_MSEX007421 [Manduca sexta]|uniref:ADAMTS/ADAMTS-like cysteine-rich domain-containing protein n=1 Tax=Manduca sexta TaxID=7130 RepID=A0A921Z753_MANSE|nr:hypothetical protein O3G_MSEX007421 [Manduca sexta]
MGTLSERNVVLGIKKSRMQQQAPGTWWWYWYLLVITEQQVQRWTSTSSVDKPLDKGRWNTLDAGFNRTIVPPANTSETPEITVRVTRQTHAEECLGVDKRYHECNTNPCAGGEVNKRAEQCAAYDRRPFRGRFYTWVPYLDGDSPCTLNCRPLGQHFYASLALVVDGTPCTKQGFRAICVQGSCKIYNLRLKYENYPGMCDYSSGLVVVYRQH